MSETNNKQFKTEYDNNEFTPSNGKYSKGLNCIAVYVEEPKGLKIGTSPVGAKKREGAWTVAVAVEEIVNDVTQKRITYYYNPIGGWVKKPADAHYFDDFEYMKQYLAKRKVNVANQTSIRFVEKPMEEMWMIVLNGSIIKTFDNEPTETEIDQYLQVNFLMTFRDFNSIKFIKTKK